MNRMLISLLLLAACSLTADAKNNGLALTPPMGWLSWERFRCEIDCEKFPDTCISERLYMSVADRLVSDGYRDAGYVYVNIDDCWATKERDSEGRLQPDPQRFPSGMKALADYIHKRGLKFGIYTAIGHATCKGYPASEFYMESDANTFAKWGVDSVKTDLCYADDSSLDVSYPTFGDYLNRTGRPMLYGCSWPMAYQTRPFNYSLVREHCNVWRTTKDIQDSWESLKTIITFYGKNKNNFAASSGPGGFSDPDELIVGDFGLSYTQQKTQFGMWAMFAAPLLMSVDLRSIRAESRALLLDRDIIAINQDPLGAQAVMLDSVLLPNSVSVWRKPLTPKENYAIAFLNMGDYGLPTSFTTKLKSIGLTNPNGYNVTDVFNKTHMGMYKPLTDLSITIDPAGIVLLRAVPLK